MSVFDDHSSTGVLSSFEDEQILKMFKISNSGASLIPKKDLWKRTHSNTPPTGVYHSEESLYKIIFGSHKCDYNKYLDVVRDFGLEVMIYRGKRFYVCNRDQKHQIRLEVIK